MASGKTLLRAEQHAELSRLAAATREGVTARRAKLAKLKEDFAALEAQERCPSSRQTAPRLDRTHPHVHACHVE